MISVVRTDSHPGPAGLGDQTGYGGPGRTAKWQPVLAAAPWIIAGLALAAFLFLLLVYAASVLPFPFDYDQGEGFDVNSGILISQGLPIYTDNAFFPYYSSNYTPVYSLFVALGVLLFGPYLWVGRLIALLATLASGAVVALAVRDQTQDRLAAAFAGLLFLASNYVYHVAPLARVNTLALAWAVGGLYCLSKRRARWTAAGLGLLLLAAYTKQTTLDAVAAGLLFLTVWRWRHGLASATALGTVGLGIAYWLNRATAGGFYLNSIQGNVNDFNLWQAADFFGNFIGSHTVVLIGAGAGLVLAARWRNLSPWPLYFVLAAGAALTVGKWGAGESYFLPTIAAACILSGTAIAYWRRHLPAWAWIVPLVVLLQWRLFWHASVDNLVPGWRDTGPQAEVLGHLVTPEDYANGWRIVRYMTDTTKEVLAEEVGFNLAAGKRVVGNTTQIKNLHLAYLWDDRQLVESLDRKEFGVVVLNGQQYPQTVLDAIGRNYQEAAVIPMNRFKYMVLLPNQ